MSKYGSKLDGTPKMKPGRKPTKGKTLNLLPTFNETGEIVGATVLGRGKPTLDVMKARRKITLPIGEDNYSFATHGPGERDPEDEAIYQGMVEDAKYKAEEAARVKAAAALHRAEEARKKAEQKLAAVNSAPTPVSSEVTLPAASVTTPTETVTV